MSRIFGVVLNRLVTGRTFFRQQFNCNSGWLHLTKIRANCWLEPFILSAVVGAEMSRLTFTRNDEPTLGVEIELQMVDAETMALANRIFDVLKLLPEDLQAAVKPELMQSYLEINTGVCHTVSEAGEDLKGKLRIVEGVMEQLGLKLFWAGSHPFSSWQDQEVTVDDRYQRLVDLMQDVARRLLTFGLHVHVGVESGDKAIAVADRMMKYLPLLLSLSSNSPFWENRNTGLHSNRSKVMEGLPTAGLPHRMRNWSEYAWLINHLKATGFINSIREIWWDIRPHHNFGTVEVRICDMPPSLNHVLSIAALIQCMVVSISREIDEGTFQADYHPTMVQQNKWRATRYGAGAELVSTQDFKQKSVSQVTLDLIQRLGPIADELKCASELQALAQIVPNAGSVQQLEIFERTGDPAAVVREMIEKNHWSREPQR